MNAPPTFNDGNSGIYWGNGGIREWGENYISPWDVWYSGGSMNGIDNLQPSYFFSKGCYKQLFHF